MKFDNITTETLKNVLTKIKNVKRSELSIWDIDDTLFVTDPKHLRIKVLNRVTGKPIVKNGKPVTVTTHEFASPEKLNAILDAVDGALMEPDSFSDFRNAKIFRKHAKAIDDNIKKAQRDYVSANKFFLLLTARANMTGDVEPLLKHFEEHGLNIRKDVRHAHLIRTRSVTATTGAEGKKEIIRVILKESPFITKVDFWDDSAANIRAFELLGKEFPKVKFVPHLIQK